MAEFILEITDIFAQQGQWFIGRCRSVADPLNNRPMDFAGEMKIKGVFPSLTMGIPYKLSAREETYKRSTILEISKGTSPERLERLINFDGVLRYLKFVKRSMDEHHKENNIKAPGIGDKKLEALSERFNLSAIKVAREDPEKVSELVKGWSSKQARIFSIWLVRHRDREEVLLELQSIGKNNALSAAQIDRIYKEHGSDAPDFIQANPYKLIKTIAGIGWSRADFLAVHNLGWSPASPARIIAGIHEVLEAETRSGHLYCCRSQALKSARQLTKQPMDFIQSMLRIDEQVIGVGQRLYLKKYRVAEETVANLIRTKAVQHPEVATKWVPGLNAKQSEAFHLAMKKGICVITGGPGRGKTHILKKIVCGLDKRHRRSQILCPTGKAAARASELTFSSARTIHHWLYKTQGKLQQEIDTFILDECSMIDLPLFARFVKTLGEQHSLIMVGDVDQLPAVGPGKVFLDIIESGLVPAVRLTEIMRTDQLGIIEAADIVNIGSDYAIQEIELISDKSFLWHNLEGEDAQERVLTMVKFLLDAGVDPDDIQIICARNGYKSMASLILSNRELNYKVSSLLNASRKDVGNDLVLRPDDRVMNLKNKHLKNFAADREENEFCANGETGKIIEVSKTHYKAKFDQGVFRFSKTEDNLIQGYAATCHKFQGSEADHVIIVFDRTASAVLDRSWLYTAITRAAVSCNVIAPEKVFKKAIEKPSKISLRRSGLAELLQPQPLKAVI